jgi:hypothetical protein
LFEHSVRILKRKYSTVWLKRAKRRFAPTEVFCSN